MYQVLVWYGTLLVPPTRTVPADLLQRNATVHGSSDFLDLILHRLADCALQRNGENGSPASFNNRGNTHTRYKLKLEI